MRRWMFVVLVLLTVSLVSVVYGEEITVDTDDTHYCNTPDTCPDGQSCKLIAIHEYSWSGILSNCDSIGVFDPCLCSDEADNDDNGLFDCQDPVCSGIKNCNDHTQACKVILDEPCTSENEQIKSFDNFEALCLGSDITDPFWYECNADGGEQLLDGGLPISEGPFNLHVFPIDLKQENYLCYNDGIKDKWAICDTVDDEVGGYICMEENGEYYWQMKQFFYELENVLVDTTALDTDNDGITDINEDSDCINVAGIIAMRDKAYLSPGCLIGDTTGDDGTPDGIVNEEDLDNINSDDFYDFQEFVKFIHTMRANWQLLIT